MNQLDEVFAECCNSIRGKPDQVGDHEIMGIALWDRSNTATPSRSSREATRLDPKNARAQACLGAALLALGNPDEARSRTSSGNRG